MKKIGAGTQIGIVSSTTLSHMIPVFIISFQFIGIPVHLRIDEIQRFIIDCQIILIILQIDTLRFIKQPIQDSCSIICTHHTIIHQQVFQYDWRYKTIHRHLRCIKSDKAIITGKAQCTVRHGYPTPIRKLTQMNTIIEWKVFNLPGRWRIRGNTLQRTHP